MVRRTIPIHEYCRHEESFPRLSLGFSQATCEVHAVLRETFCCKDGEGVGPNKNDVPELLKWVFAARKILFSTCGNPICISFLLRRTVAMALFESCASICMMFSADLHYCMAIITIIVRVIVLVLILPRLCPVAVILIELCMTSVSISPSRLGFSH